MNIIKKIFRKMKSVAKAIGLHIPGIKKCIYNNWLVKYRNELRKNAIDAGKELDIENKNYIIYLEEMKVHFYLPYYATDLIQQEIISTKQYYEKNLLDYICKQYQGGVIGRAIQDKAVCDIGSNIGNHTLYFMLECGAAWGYAFEPVKDTFNILKKNIEINNLSNRTEIFNVGIGEKSGKSDIISYDKGNIGGTVLEVNETGDIPIISVDSLNISREVALIKIDTEGFELKVIKGLLQTIRKYRPYIMIEIQKENIKEIKEIMHGQGYEYEMWDDFNYIFSPQNNG